MSVSLVQNQTLNSGANVIVNPNGAGNCILVFALFDGTSAGTISCTDSNGNSYTQLGYFTFTTGGPQVSAAALFVAKNINAGPNTITLNNSQTSTAHFAVAAEYAGVDAVAPVSANQYQPYPFPPGTANLPVTIATALNNDVVALFYQNRNCTGITLPAGFTSRQQVVSGGDSSGFSDATIATAGSATYTVDFTTAGATGGAIWAAALTAPAAPTLVSISVTPTSASIAQGATQQFTATGHYSDSSTADITSIVTWASSSPSIATIASGGLATGVTNGSTNITATLSAITSNAAVLAVTTSSQITLTGTFSFANDARPSGGSVSFTRRAYHDENHVQLLTAGTPITAQLDSRGNFSIALPTFSDIVSVTPYAMVVFDSAGNFLMERFVGFSGAGTHLFNDVPEQESGTAFPPQYADTGFKQIQGSFGSQAANGTATFRLYQQAVSSNGIEIIPSDIVLQLDGSGNLSAGSYFYLSSDLSPATLYLVVVKNSIGQQIAKTMYSLSETSSGVCDLGHLATSVPAPGLERNYVVVPGELWATIPWKKI